MPLSVLTQERNVPTLTSSDLYLVASKTPNLGGLGILSLQNFGHGAKIAKSWSIC